MTRLSEWFWKHPYTVRLPMYALVLTLAQLLGLAIGTRLAQP